MDFHHGNSNVNFNFLFVFFFFKEKKRGDEDTTAGEVQTVRKLDNNWRLIHSGTGKSFELSRWGEKVGGQDGLYRSGKKEKLRSSARAQKVFLKNKNK